MIPDKHLLGIEVGIDLAAIGHRSRSGGPLRLGGTAERADEVAANLESSLDPGARDPVSSEPISDAFTDVEVTRDSVDGVEVVRAELEPAAGVEAGWLLGTIASGSLVSLINGDEESFLR